MTATNEALAALKERWGARWQIWFVPLALGGMTWCARRHGDELVNVLHADRPRPPGRVPG